MQALRRRCCSIRTREVSHSELDLTVGKLPPKDTMQISRSKSDSLHRTPAGFTTLAIDGDGLRECLPARPTSAASYPISVRRLATLLHASFRRSLAVPPLRFASASPPSGYTGDFHPQAVGHVRHTGWRVSRPRFAACGLDRMSPARPRLAKQAKQIRRTRPSQNLIDGRVAF